MSTAPFRALLTLGLAGALIVALTGNEVAGVTLAALVIVTAVFFSSTKV